jgi:hypothetical protein
MERAKRFKVPACRLERNVPAQKLDDIELAFDEFGCGGRHLIRL